MKPTGPISGKDRLWLWFELPRASWLTIPRVTRVQLTHYSRLTKDYNWLLKYRHPDKRKVDALRPK